MGSAAGAQPGGGSPSVFQPPGQEAAAGMLGGLVGPLYGQAMSGNTPGAWSYPQAQGFVGQSYNPTQQYLTGSPTGAPTLFDQSSGLGYGSALNASNLYSQGVGNTYGQIPALAGAAAGALPYASNIMETAFSPAYGQAVTDAQNNPFYPGALAGAQQGAALGGAGANALYGSGMGILQQGFDPQGALFGRTQQQLADQLGAVNSMSGVGSSPYGAGVMGKGLSDFDINWQNNQLQRMEGAAGAASPLLQAAPGMAYQSGQMPTQAYMGHIGDILGALKAQQAGQGAGASSLSALLGGAGQGLGQAQNILGASTGGLASSGMLPYSAGATIGNNAVSGLNNQQSLLSGATALGNQQYQLPQMLIKDLMDYLSGGRSAATDSANIGNMGFNQTAQGFGGLLGGLNTLFGKSGIAPLFGAGGLLGL